MHWQSSSYLSHSVFSKFDFRMNPSDAAVLFQFTILYEFNQ
jgi:hypothetical protein